MAHEASAHQQRLNPGHTCGSPESWATRELLAFQSFSSCTRFFSPLCMLRSISHVQLFKTLRMVARQAPLSWGFSRQEYWSGLPFPSPGDLPDPGIEPGSPAWWADSLPTAMRESLLPNLFGFFPCPTSQTKVFGPRQIEVVIINTFSSSWFRRQCF